MPKIPKAWLPKHGKPKEETEMNLKMDNNTSTVLLYICVALCLFGVSWQIRSCNADDNAAETICLKAGGDPYKCCVQRAYTPVGRSKCNVYKKKDNR